MTPGISCQLPKCKSPYSTDVIYVGPFRRPTPSSDLRDRGFPCPAGNSLIWCGRRDLNPHSLARSRFSYHFGFRRRLWAFVVWTVPSPWPSQALGATRPVSTPSPNRGLGSGLAWGVSPLAFPDFERFYSADFPTGTPVKVCCVYRFRHVRMTRFVPHRAHARNCGVHAVLQCCPQCLPFHDTGGLCDLSPSSCQGKGGSHRPTTRLDLLRQTAHFLIAHPCLLWCPIPILTSVRPLRRSNA
jgi:hypothetical protein